MSAIIGERPPIFPPEKNRHSLGSVSETPLLAAAGSASDRAKLFIVVDDSRFFPGEKIGAAPVLKVGDVPALAFGEKRATCSLCEIPCCSLLFPANSL